MVVSTSANYAGDRAPARFEDIDPRILEEVDVAVKSSPGHGVASSLVVVEDGRPVILREGAVSMETLLSKLKQT
jgi:tRNA A37 threonylcarbamoyladenosine synthetase subunit TsaC/SUA5/YrdC